MHLIRSIAQAIFALLATLFAVGASAQEPAAVVTTALPAPAPRPALWKVADADTTIYLFGTIHALPPGVQWMTGPIEQALASSEQLVTEIPDTPPEEMKAAVLSNAMLPAGQNLRQMLDDAQRAKFESAVTGFGFPVDAFDRFEPWYAAVALTALPLEKIGYTAGNGVEERIAAEALRLRKPRKLVRHCDDGGNLLAGQGLRIQGNARGNLGRALRHNIGGCTGKDLCLRGARINRDGVRGDGIQNGNIADACQERIGQVLACIRAPCATPVLSGNG